MNGKKGKYPYANISKNLFFGIKLTVVLTVILSIVAFILSLTAGIVIKVSKWIFDPNYLHEWYKKTNESNDGMMDKVPLLKYVYVDTSNWSNNITKWIGLDGDSLIMKILTYAIILLTVFIVLYIFTLIMRHHKGEMAPFWNDREASRLKRKILRNIGAKYWDVYDESDRKIKRVEHAARYRLRRMKVNIHTTIEKGQPQPTKKYEVVIKRPSKNKVRKLVLQKIKDLQEDLTSETEVSFDQMKTTANKRFYLFEGAIETELKEARSVIKRRNRKQTSEEDTEGESIQRELTFPLELINDVESEVEKGKRESQAFADRNQGKILTVLSTAKLQPELKEVMLSSKTVVFSYKYAYSNNKPYDDKIAMSISDELKIKNISVMSGAGVIDVTVPLPKDIKIPIDLKNILKNEFMSGKKIHDTQVIYGVKPSGEVMSDALANAPHSLVVGATGSGKSVSLNTTLVTLCAHNTPDDIRILIVDPKLVEFKLYENSPFLLTNPITDVEDGEKALKYAVYEMQKRYDQFQRAKVKKIEDYNKWAKQNGEKKMPFWVIVIDEFSDFKDSLDDFSVIETQVKRLGQKARAAGIHLIIATQTPRREVLTGIIRANLPTTIAFRVTKRLESQIALDENGAEKLLGKGDMLFQSAEGMVRAQGPFITDDELAAITKHWREKFEKPVYVDYKAVVDRLEGEESGEVIEQQEAIGGLQQTMLENESKTSPKRETALEKAEKRKKEKEKRLPVDMSQYFNTTPSKNKQTDSSVEKKEQKAKSSISEETKKDKDKSISDLLGL
ncbi:FtsK/SpoIIIE domain-containing protein [Mammaliicoccus sciuri]|uniref:FtsK/SpoIIIE domain-containing protein n=1 Tax=Mammaliicoccus sciuri TaxID=1296 RepID=UPI001AAEC533|nr:FtsK/SpoIIIE domain-containing protein [Mammaliicoccus sciuri]MBO3081166.1 DNA translocase FtsK [Mammaliicoccus sciuri]